ncbi:MAG: vanadium-dependent haloperoxidase [Acidimicrobiaceae bacterium]|nr:vanadium-dependent haloperoxidase [Acidimicrobiaceae bacterium]MDE0607194.1 vanadium-dependent haloperoxidase [Acidimicrobiaceae bacterium]
MKQLLAILCAFTVLAAACADDSDDSDSSASQQAEAGMLTREGPNGEFDLVNGNAMHGILIPRLGPWASSEVSPALNDASVVFRYTVQMYSAAFDAVAPYDETAVGIYSRIGRRPASESTDNLLPNTAVMHALYRLMLDFAPHRTEEWRAMLADHGLDPDDESGLDWPCDSGARTDATAAAIGNLAARCTLDARRNDGFNQFGDVNGVEWTDTTGYVPFNTPYELRDASRWQPLIVPLTDGVFRSQVFVTPQWANIEPFSGFNPRDFRVAAPADSDHTNTEAYAAQAQEVLDESANLDDYKKEIVMFFDNKLRGSQILPDVKHLVDIVDFIQVSFLVEMASHDVGVVVWQEKQRFDAVRPITAIHHLFGDDAVSAWAGPGQGTGTMPGSSWRSFANTADHPEYPSATTSFCGAYAQSLRRYANVEDATGGYRGVRAAGSNPVEPGVTPAQDLEIDFENWSDYEEACAASRVWGGVHFWPSVEVAIPLGNQIGDLAYDYWATLMDGSAPLRGPALPLAPDPLLDEPHWTGR